MKKNYNIIVFFVFSLFSSHFSAQSPSFEWGNSIGSSDDDYSSSIITDSSGNIYTTGYYTGTVDFEPGPGTTNMTAVGDKDIYIKKTDSNGNFIWVKSIGGTGYDIATSLTSDTTGNLYITGGFSGTVDFNPNVGTYNLTSYNNNWDFFVLKLDSNGNFIWANSNGGTSTDLSYSIDLDSSNNVYIAGFFYGTTDFDPGVGTTNITASGCNDIFIQKFDPNGNLVWVKTIGNTGCDQAKSLTIDKNDNIYTIGSFSDTVDFDPNAGVSNLSSNGSSEVFILKLDSNGDFVWVKSFQEVSSGEFGYQANSLVTDNSGDIIITGSYSGTVDFDPGSGISALSTNALGDIYVVKLDNSGNFIWLKSMSSNTTGLYSNGASLITDASKNIYVCGAFSGTIDFNPNTEIENLTSVGDNDAYIQKLDASGNFLWVISFGTGAPGTWCSAYSITNDFSNNLYVTGGFNGTVDLDFNSGIEDYTSAGNRDVFNLKINQQTAENIIWSSDSSDYANFSATNNDGDSFTWETENGNVAGKGLITDTSFFSKSYDDIAGALTPDNLLITPTGAITVPSNASSISFKLNVEASSSDRPAEHFAIYVFDEAVGQSFDTKIYEETLTVGGSGTAKDITAAIPITFAGKNIGIIVRHFNTVGQDKLYVDDFEVSYEASTLSTEKKNINNLTVYPNPTKNKVYLNLDQESSYVLTNINGQVIISNILDKGENTINLSELQNGLYFLNIKSSLGTITKKIIKN
ncbi:hypothetical protein BWZ22_05840 [Seonamhaeicola sp. S2-3]|uniref:T9SS type A sorting domain-containing protein n=1 Tax=Seonamhaeicola sp. S2-3 TaxID=1936081 RepID=UPI000972690A|nr:T9SS type A sorting domain-containing protein [Seonamhaeicola sp. S2-3]APY10789.1 hypothetical protein BWZ22_05840 [Seonamhaeicola sp. S2-3]